jgi:hypothetical protein
MIDAEAIRQVAVQEIVRQVSSNQRIRHLDRPDIALIEFPRDIDVVRNDIGFAWISPQVWFQCARVFGLIACVPRRCRPSVMRLRASRINSNAISQQTDPALLDLRCPTRT